MNLILSFFRIIWLLLLFVLMLPVAFVLAMFTPREQWDALGIKIKDFFKRVS